MKTYWTPEIGRRNQAQLIKIMRDKQKKPNCLMCEDRGYVEVGSGPLGGSVKCECQEEKEKCINCGEELDEYYNSIDECMYDNVCDKCQETQW